MDEPSAKGFELTASLEDYLEAIKVLCEETDHNHAHTSGIARRLKVKMPSVTNALGVLRRHGYINYDTSHPVTLTELGEQEAARVIRRHSVLSSFLNRVLQLPTEEASATACRVEHVIDDSLLARLELLTEELLNTSHGAAVCTALAATYPQSTESPKGSCHDA